MSHKKAIEICDEIAEITQRIVYGGATEEDYDLLPTAEESFSLTFTPEVVRGLLELVEASAGVPELCSPEWLAAYDALMAKIGGE